MKIFQEFKEFAMRGNVIDLAVGVVIGGAFGNITNSLVKDVIMPPLGAVLGKVNFSQLKITLTELPGLDPVTVNYGAFIQTIVNFLIVAWAMFMIVKMMNRLKRKQDTAPPDEKPAPPPRQEVLLEEIRDLLKAQKIQ